jgi:hypothetical protein
MRLHQCPRSSVSRSIFRRVSLTCSRIAQLQSRKRDRQNRFSRATVQSRTGCRCRTPKSQRLLERVSVYRIDVAPRRGLITRKRQSCSFTRRLSGVDEERASRGARFQIVALRASPACVDSRWLVCDPKNTKAAISGGLCVQAPVDGAGREETSACRAAACCRRDWFVVVSFACGDAACQIPGHMLPVRIKRAP